MREIYRTKNRSRMGQLILETDGVQEYIRWSSGNHPSTFRSRIEVLVNVMKWKYLNMSVRELKGWVLANSTEEEIALAVLETL